MILSAIRIGLLSIWALHPFHVSVSEVHYNDQTKTLEISIRMFTDDIELAVQKQGHENFSLSGQTDRKVADEYLAGYLAERFKISVDENPLNLQYLGYEMDEDATICYIESGKVDSIGKIEIYNDLLTDVVEDQINLTHFEYQGKTKSFRAVKGNTSAIIDTSSW